MPGGRGVALIITLALLTVATVLLLALVSQTRNDLGASHHYTQASAATEMGMAGLEFVVNQLQQEMGKDQAPNLAYPGSPLYTNVGTANLLPQPVGTNSAMPLLVKTSTTAPPFTGALASGTLVASTVSTATPSLNNRIFPASRWNAPFLGTFPSTAVPSWVIMTRGGPGSGAGLGFGTASDAVNNPAIGNTNFAIGRFAYAVYDVSGLLDITVAGYPSGAPPGGLTTAQIQAIKGTLAGADVSALGIDATRLTQWRNAASAASASSYLDFVTNFAATNGFKGVYPGDTTFLSRQELIKAAQAGTAGLSTSILPSLTVFSRERNSPSWWPQGTSTTIDYHTLAATASATNVFVPLVRYAATNSITSYKIDGATSYTYNVYPGDPLVYYRFPLDRIRWISASGPANGASAAAIQACFGLQWNPPTGVWQYVGPAPGTTEVTGVKTLAQVAAETPPREANFFELLQAGILTGSLGLEGYYTKGGALNGSSYETIQEASPLLQIFRIGASILTQYQPDACPIVVEFKQPKITSGAISYTPNVAWQAAGIANLPYVNMVGPIGGTSSDTPNAVASYQTVGLWNPHRGTGTITAANRPQVRLRIQGSTGLVNSFFAYPGTPYGTVVCNWGSIPGKAFLLNDQINLSTAANVGVNGFADPAAPTTSDLATVVNAGTGAGMAWSSFDLPPAVTATQYVGYRLPDMTFDPTYAYPTTGPYAYGNNSQMYTSVNITPNCDQSLTGRFNCWLEFQSGPGKPWVPYSYWTGINDPYTWMPKCNGLVAFPMGSGTTAQPTALNMPLGFTVKYFWERDDPRALRFNYGVNQITPYPDIYRFLYGSRWSAVTESSSQALGRLNTQWGQPLLGSTATGRYLPAGMARNNTQSSFTAGSTTVLASYADPDGVARIADSGLFTATPAAANGWQGDPFAVAATRKTDRPVILNRPFVSVGELGYVDRDDPWRTLDFFTANSADAGLLDLFTVSRSSDAVVRGKINPGAAGAAILQAILKNSACDVETGSALSNPAAVASSLTNLTSVAANRLTGRDQLVTKLVAALPSTSFTGTDEPNVKAQREEVTRALADVSQTRTWNLLIDIVAQSGRYPSTSTALNQFVVDGEQRFWLHVAIDRFTGKVIDQQLEAVTP